MENLEQPENGSNVDIGKFKDVESLYKAYSNLEAEFTKKSQRLASLEEETKLINEETQRANEREQRVQELVNKFDSVKPFSSALKETLKSNESANLEEEALSLIVKNYKTADQYATDSEFLNNYIFSNKEIQDRIVKDYLSRLTQSSPIKTDIGGSSVSLTPPNIPSTIREAGKLAKSIIKNK